MKDVVCFLVDIFDIADALLILYFFNVVFLLFSLCFSSLSPFLFFSGSSNITIFIGLTSIEIWKWLFDYLVFQNTFIS